MVHSCPLTRRCFILTLLAGAAAATNALEVPAENPTSGEGAFNAQQLREMEAVAGAFMAQHGVPALSVAIARQGRLAYVQAFGLANKQEQEKLTPKHLFRIASLSKPITSVAIFRLLEAGKLRLSDTVFGAQGLLGNAYGQPPFQPHLEEITLEHLLTHTAGGWQNDGNDPMFAHAEMDHSQLISHTIAHQLLDYPPGQHYAYSNFGFCILGRVIEKLTGKSYAEAVQQEVFKPCGIEGMRLGANSLAERNPLEVVYYDPNGEDPYGMNVRRMDSHGGWLATPTDLVRFLVRVDGFPTKPDILKPETIRIMTTGSVAAPDYAKGWCINRSNNWWHTGSLPGTTSVMVRTSGQFCWAALTNTRGANSTGNLDRLVWDMIGKIQTWPKHDLF